MALLVARLVEQADSTGVGYLGEHREVGSQPVVGGAEGKGITGGYGG